MKLFRFILANAIWIVLGWPLLLISWIGTLADNLCGTLHDKLWDFTDWISGEDTK